MARITAVCISEKKGTVKKNTGSVLCIKGHGFAKDAHAGTERQVSLLSAESFHEFESRIGRNLEAGTFGENLLIEGLDLSQCIIGTRIRCGEALLEVTHIGKKCHTNCEIRNITGDCIMPREGIFAKVLEGGYIRVGDKADIVLRHPFRAAVLTASDRAFFGGYEDRSGPVIADVLGRHGYDIAERALTSDDEDEVYNEIIRLCGLSPDILIISGGTGFSLRDRVPEATLRAADRNAPGIAEAIRTYSMQITPNAMLSRAVSVIRGRTLIIDIPGSPKAARECLEYILPILSHGIMLLRGEADK